MYGEVWSKGKTFEKACNESCHDFWAEQTDMHHVEFDFYKKRWQSC